jgi:hypothetical protein
MTFKQWLKKEGYFTEYKDVLVRCKGTRSLADKEWQEMGEEYQDFCKKEGITPVDIEAVEKAV